MAALHLKSLLTCLLAGKFSCTSIDLACRSHICMQQLHRRCEAVTSARAEYLPGYLPDQQPFTGKQHGSV
jgi:hypothetical protein